MNGCLESALAYAEHGWRVFPVEGKVPLVKDWPNVATTDTAQVRTWWGQRPMANVGIATGAGSDIYVIDEDAGGADTIAKLNLPETLTIRTGGGGHHYYFKRPEGEHWPNTAKKLGPGVDTRGDGGYVVAPPSVHPDSRRPYQVEVRKNLAPLTGPVLELLKPKAVERERVEYRSDDIPRGYGETALRNECEAVANAPDGQRNHALNRAAFSLGQLVASGVIDEGYLRAELGAAARAAGLAEREIEKTIESGMKAGLAQPRQVPERRLAVVRPSSGGSSAPPAPSDPKGRTPWEEALHKARLDLELQVGAVADASAPLFESTAELMDAELPDTAWLIEGLLTEGAVAVVSGEPKTTKTWAALHMGLALAAGRKAFGEFWVPRPRPVAAFLTEDGRRGLRNRLRSFCAAQGLEPREVTRNMHHSCMKRIDLRRIEDATLLLASVRMLPEPPALIVVDPLRNVIGNANEDKAHEMAPVLETMRALRALTGATIQFVHHASKIGESSKGRRGGQKMRGSGAIHGAIDCGLYLDNLKGDATNRWLNTATIEVKDAQGAGSFGLELNVEDEKRAAVRAEFTFWRDPDSMYQAAPEGRPDDAVGARVRRILAGNGGPMSTSEIATVAQMHERVVRRVLVAAAAQGLVVRKGNGKNTRWMTNEPEEEDGAED